MKVFKPSATLNATSDYKKTTNYFKPTWASFSFLANESFNCKKSKNHQILSHNHTVHGAKSITKYTTALGTYVIFKHKTDCAKY